MKLTVRHLVNGVLTDLTSITLRDPTNTYGVRRTDNNDIIAPASTSMNHVGTGIYTYDFVEPAGGLTYEYWATWIYNSVLSQTQYFAVGTPAVQPVDQGMTISTARKFARYFSRNAGDTTYYPTFMVDMAIKRAANLLIRLAHLCMRTDGKVTQAGVSDYTTSAATFRCERLDSAFLTGDNVVVNGGGNFGRDESLYVRGGQVGCGYGTYISARLEIIDYTDLNDLLIGQPRSGQPQCIAFQNDGTYSLWPVPDQVYTVNLRWADFFTVWNYGIPLTSFTNTAGVLSSVVVVDGSDNLGASIAGAFSDTSGTGSGATATPVLSNGVLASVTVGGGGGSGYSTATKLLIGGYDSADQNLNLPDDLMYEVLSLGAPAFLQFNDPEHAFATKKGDEFQAFIKQIAGKIGGLGVKRIIRK